MSVNEKMTAIADAIRDKTGGTEPLGLDAMASGVGEVYDKGVTDGREAEWRDFWDSYQANDTRTNYDYAFYMWPDEAFKPKYSFTKDKTCSYNYAFYQSTITDLSKHAFKSQAMNYAWFGCSQLEKIGTIINTGSTFTATFNGCNSLHTIGTIACTSYCTFSSTFGGCYNLQEIKFGGQIGRSIDFSDCPLSADSVASLFSRLVAPTATNQSLKFGTLNVITDAQIASATALGWTIVIGTEVHRP